MSLLLQTDFYVFMRNKAAVFAEEFIRTHFILRVFASVRRYVFECLVIKFLLQVPSMSRDEQMVQYTQ